MKGWVIIGCGLVVALAATEAAARGLRLGGWASYTPLNLGDIYETASSTAAATIEGKKVDTGVIGGADLGIEVAPGVTAGMRIGYLYGVPVTQDLILFVAKITIEQSASYLPLMAGVSYHLDIGPALTVGVSLYAGYGFASYTRRMTMGSVNQTVFPMETISQTLALSGGGLVADAMVAAGVKFSPSIALALNVGYRCVLVPQLTIAQSIENGPQKGEVFKKLNGEPTADHGFFRHRCRRQDFVRLLSTDVANLHLTFVIGTAPRIPGPRPPRGDPACAAAPLDFPPREKVPFSPCIPCASVQYFWTCPYS